MDPVTAGALAELIASAVSAVAGRSWKKVRGTPEGRAVKAAIGVAVGDGCLVRSHATGRLQEMVILTMGADERGVLETIAVGVNAEKVLRRAAGIAGNPGPVHVRPGSTGSRLALWSRSAFSRIAQISVLPLRVD